jgi:K+-sensing histidine kinase KdpD
MWHAVGHEIMSPLQSLMALHGPETPGHRYVQRMQQAIHVLYGTASPAEALQAANVPEGRLDLHDFLRNVADNAHFAGILDVRYVPPSQATGAVIVRADEFALEDVVTHILRNADRYRPAGTPITLSLTASESTASATLHNQGSTIAEDLLERIFELGVSDPSLPLPPGEGEHRGQGLFVAKTYMAKMGGTINARNTDDGVAFVLTFQRLG